MLLVPPLATIYRHLGMIAHPRFTVVFEDRHLIVVDKSARLLTVPTAQGERNTLIQLLEQYLDHRGSRRRIPGPVRGRDRVSPSGTEVRRGSDRSRRARARAVEAVHRLDRDTSGLLVFSKDPATSESLRAQFRVHSVVRIYLAIVAGRMDRDEGTFDSYLTTNEAMQRYSTRVRGAGERAITHYRVRSRGPDSTTVDVRLETGRRNQIRVHFAEAGHPVLGDRRYGSRAPSHPAWPANRLALHASVLGLVHPATGETMRWESAVPAPFRAFMGKQTRS